MISYLCTESDCGQYHKRPKSVLCYKSVLSIKLDGTTNNFIVAAASHTGIFLEIIIWCH